MKLTDFEKKVIQKYGPTYLEKGDIKGFLQAVYSHGAESLRYDEINFEKVKSWLVACEVDMPLNFKPKFIVDGKSHNICPKNCDWSNVIFDSSATSIEPDTFYKCTAITDATVPSNITTVRNWGFANCSKLKKVTFEGAVKSLEFCAFKDCAELEEVDFKQASLQKIEDEAFLRCTKLKRITNLQSVSTIGKQAFVECISLESLELGDVNFTDKNVFAYCGNLKSISIKSMTNRISKSLGLFEGCTSLQEVHTSDRKLIAYINKYYPNVRVVK